MNYDKNPNLFEEQMINQTYDSLYFFLLSPENNMCKLYNTCTCTTCALCVDLNACLNR